jgi:large subunit ribosomal protein L25
MSKRPTIELRAAVRSELGRQARSLRKHGLVPGAVYRHGRDTLHLTLDADAFARVYRRAGTARPVDLMVEAIPPMQVLVHKVERHPITGHLRHVVLLELRMSEKVTVEIPVRFLGEAPAVADHGATILTQCEHLRVSALPGDLPSHVDADLSVLRAAHDTLRVGDLAFPPNITVLNDSDEVVATAVPPVKRAEPEGAVPEAGPSEPERIGAAEGSGEAGAEK